MPRVVPSAHERRRLALLTSQPAPGHGVMWRGRGRRRRHELHSLPGGTSSAWLGGVSSFHFLCDFRERESREEEKKTNPKTPISFHIIKTTRVHTSVTPRTQPRADRKPRTRIHKPAKQPKDTNSVTRKQGIADPDRAVTLSLSQPDKN